MSQNNNHPHSYITTNQGAPVGDNQNSRTAGQNGPTLLEDYHLLEKMAHFDRERIPERVVHARGAGAFGTFKVEKPMNRYTIIGPSEDKLLQGRLFSYPDTQRYRLSANYLQIPVNCPYATVQNNQRDSSMQMKPQGGSINYEPTRHADAPKEAPAYRDSSMPLNGTAGRQKIVKTNDFAQAGDTFRSFSEQEQANFISNLVGDLATVHEKSKLLAVCNFYRADAKLGEALAAGLNVDVSGYLQHLNR